MATSSSPPPFDKDCCCEIEVAVEHIIAIIKLRWHDEKGRCLMTKLLPDLGDGDIYFGYPAVAPGHMVVAVRPERQVPQEERGRSIEPGLPDVTGVVPCERFVRWQIGIRWWWYDADFQDCARNVARMGEVLKRIISRNPRLITDKASVYKAWWTDIDSGTKVLSSFQGKRVAYGQGDMTVVALCLERYVSEVDL